MILEKLIRYKILDYCLDILFNKLHTNFFIINKVNKGAFFKKIIYTLEHHARASMTCTDCIITRRFINDGNEDYIEFSFDSMYANGDVIHHSKTNIRSKTQAPVSRLTFIE